MNGAESNFNGRLRPKTNEPTNWVDLIKLPNEKLAFIYQRLSTHEQTKKSIYSVKAQDALFDMAKEDGYADHQIHVERRDLGISGTKGREEREGLAHLIKLVEDGLVEAIYVVHISRLYRDQTLINAFALGELFKEYNVIIVTPQMRLNLRDKMHMRLYRMEAERAADELELMAYRLLGARNLKAKAGYYAGESLPQGIVVDERKHLEDGSLNPNYHTYQIYEPHAQLVRTIFSQLLMPGTTATRVARYCKEQGIVFAQFPPELNTNVHLKTFQRTKRNSDGSWVIGVSMIRGIATNPAYIGWKIWQGEVVNKDTYPPIVDEATFWTVQKLFQKRVKPKEEYDPLPLGGLLYCGNHDTPHFVGYTNHKRPGHSYYYCCEDTTRSTCWYITDHILDRPISEAVINQIALPNLAAQILSKLTSEYEQAKEQAASYRREVKRLESEVENLRTNLTMGVLSPTQISWIDEQIQNRLTRIKELADLEKQPIGAIGKPVPGQADIELVESFLNRLGDIWQAQPNGLKNAFLRLLLDKVILYNEAETVRVRLFWRIGLEQELLIHKPVNQDKHRKWSEAEVEILRQNYTTSIKQDLMAMLPGRRWKTIKNKAKYMGLSERPWRKMANWYRFTSEDDDVIRRFYAREISQGEAEALTGKAIESIRYRASKLGLIKQKARATWEWINIGTIPEEEEASK